VLLRRRFNLIGVVSGGPFVRPCNAIHKSFNGSRRSNKLRTRRSPFFGYLTSESGRRRKARRPVRLCRLASLILVASRQFAFLQPASCAHPARCLAASAALADLNSNEHFGQGVYEYSPGERSYLSLRLWGSSKGSTVTAAP